MSPSPGSQAGGASPPTTAGVAEVDAGSGSVFGTDLVTATGRSATRGSTAGPGTDTGRQVGARPLERNLPFLVRVLLLGMLLLLVSMAVLAALTADSVGGLVEAIRRREAVAAEPVRPLPGPAVIADPLRFAEALRRRPGRRRDLLALRAAHLLDRGRTAEAAAVYARIRSDEAAGLRHAETLDYARALIELRDLERARRLLVELLADSEAGPERRRIIDLLLGIDLAGEAG